MLHGAHQDEVTSILLQATPIQGPLVIIPSLSEDGVAANAQVSVYTDRELHQALQLPEIFHPVLCSQWTAETAGGCHLYFLLDKILQFV